VKTIRCFIGCLGLVGLLFICGCAINTKPLLVREQAAQDVYKSIVEINTTTTKLEEYKLIASDESLQLQLALVPTLVLNNDLVTTILDWQSGPPPPIMLGLVQSLKVFVHDVDQILPDDSPGKLLIFQAVSRAIQAMTILVIILTQGAGLNA
jgi:hypothetical protein